MKDRDHNDNIVDQQLTEQGSGLYKDPESIEMARLWLGIREDHRARFEELGERFGCSPSWAARRVKRTLRAIVVEYLETGQKK